MSKVLIGIPCYRDVAAETLEDYMRFAFYLGRKTQHECFLAIKTKSEQFRARNAIVEAALQAGADYLLFLDDDHVINWEGTYETHSRYGFLDTLISHMKADPNRAIVGCLYYHRGGDCRPVLMKEGNDCGYYYMRDDEIVNGLQQVDVQGGGCMLIDMNLFSRIPSPWFEPETGLGTDLQICKKAKEAGKTVWCDTSIVLGHVKSAREVVTPLNRHRIISESGHVGKEVQGLNTEYKAQSSYNLYRMDAEEYLQMDFEGITNLANTYFTKNMARFSDYENKDDYYKSLGTEQLARQVWFHSDPGIMQQFQIIQNFLKAGDFYGLDYGCGSSPVGLDMVIRAGHKVDFVDLDGTPAYEFLKWRAKRRRVDHKCGWRLNGQYDYAMFLDSIEHFQNWKQILTDVCSKIVNNGVIITNYFLNEDFDNNEHISMDHQSVKDHLISLGFYPVNSMVWMKRDFGFMDKPKAA